MQNRASKPTKSFKSFEGKGIVIYGSLTINNTVLYKYKTKNNTGIIILLRSNVIPLVKLLMKQKNNYFINCINYICNDEKCCF